MLPDDVTPPQIQGGIPAHYSRQKSAFRRHLGALPPHTSKNGTMSPHGPKIGLSVNPAVRSEPPHSHSHSLILSTSRRLPRSQALDWMGIKRQPRPDLLRFVECRVSLRSRQQFVGALHGARKMTALRQEAGVNWEVRDQGPSRLRKPGALNRHDGLKTSRPQAFNPAHRQAPPEYSPAIPHSRHGPDWK